MASVCHVEFAKLLHFFGSVTCARTLNCADSRLSYSDKTIFKWRPTAILNFRNLVLWSYDLCNNAIMIYPTKFSVNRIITGWDIARRRFSIWRPFATLNLQNFGRPILLSSQPWKHNLHLHTEFRWNRMISGWDIAIKLFSKWRPSAILNFRNSVFWS